MPLTDVVLPPDMEDPAVVNPPMYPSDPYSMGPMGPYDDYTPQFQGQPSGFKDFGRNNPSKRHAPEILLGKPVQFKVAPPPMHDGKTSMIHDVLLKKKTTTTTTTTTVKPQVWVARQTAQPEVDLDSFAEHLREVSARGIASRIPKPPVNSDKQLFSVGTNGNVNNQDFRNSVMERYHEAKVKQVTTTLKATTTTPALPKGEVKVGGVKLPNRVIHNDGLFSAGENNNGISDSALRKSVADRYHEIIAKETTLRPRPTTTTTKVTTSTVKPFMKYPSAFANKENGKENPTRADFLSGLFSSLSEGDSARPTNGQRS